MFRLDMRLPVIGLVIAGMLMIATVANAELVTGTVTSNTSDYYPVSRASDGFSGDGHTWVTEDNSPDYFAGRPAAVLTIDLGANKTIDGLALWNYNSVGNRTKDFSLKFATEAEGAGSFGASIAYNPAFTFTAEGDATVFPRQDFAFGQGVLARYVQMTITDNFFGLGDGGDRVGLSEIQFSSIPEPGSLALLATGLVGLLAYAWRKRR